MPRPILETLAREIKQPVLLLDGIVDSCGTITLPRQTPAAMTMQNDILVRLGSHSTAYEGCPICALADRARHGQIRQWADRNYRNSDSRG